MMTDAVSNAQPLPTGMALQSTVQLIPDSGRTEYLDVDTDGQADVNPGLFKKVGLQSWVYN